LYEVIGEPSFIVSDTRLEADAQVAWIWVWEAELPLTGGKPKNPKAEKTFWNL
jgi:hypothetical protein